MCRVIGVIGGGDGNVCKDVLGHAHACLEHCRRAAVSLFGSIPLPLRGGQEGRGGGGSGGGGGGVGGELEYPVVMAHKDAMHRLQQQQKQVSSSPTHVCVYVCMYICIHICNIYI